MKIKLTRPDGSSLWLIDGMLVEPADGGAPGSLTRITIGATVRYVKEPPEEVIARLSGSLTS
jgi:hypothetical protein